MTWAQWVLLTIGVYGVCGAVFCVAFLLRGIFRADPSARGSHPAFFLLIVPGVVALWPVMLIAWLRAPRGAAR